MKTRLPMVLPLVLSFSIAAFGWNPSGGSSQDSDVQRWEESIREFEQQDESVPGQPVEILFMGSSSIRRWELEHDFPGLAVLNRGFGGSQISDSIYYFKRIVSKHAPKTVVLYAGDNDINAGKSPDAVFRDFQVLAGLVRDGLPGTRLIYICIKPSLQRWHLVETMRQANRLIRDFSETQDWIEYVDVDTPMIGGDGKPRAELFVEDGLHLSEKGYQLWTSLLLPFLSSGTTE